MGLKENSLLTSEKENSIHVEELVQTLGRMEKRLRNRSITYVKVSWKHHKMVEETWEPEKEIRGKHPTFIPPK